MMRAASGETRTLGHGQKDRVDRTQNSPGIGDIENEKKLPFSNFSSYVHSRYIRKVVSLAGGNLIPTLPLSILDTRKQMLKQPC